MYTNIPRAETTNIIHNILKTNQNINDDNQKEIIHTLDTIMEQNYFQFQQKYFKQTEGLAMGAPTSSILAEEYIENMEHKQIDQILLKHKIIGYFRYIDDILLIYNQNKTNIEEILAELNKHQP
jgi:hypothetical protein